MKKLADLKQGGYFFYGGVQWVVLENNDKIGATLALAAEPERLARFVLAPGTERAVS